MEKQNSELILTDGKQDDVRKARRKSDVLGATGRKEGRQTSQGRNYQGHDILVLVAGTLNSDTVKREFESDCTVGNSPRIDPGGYPHQV